MASQKADTMSSFTRSIVNWIDFIEEAVNRYNKASIFSTSIPELLHDLRLLLVLMSTTTVIKLATEEPHLAHFLASICPIPEYKAHIQVSRILVKCILYLALGPRDDNHLPPSIRAQRRSTALQWALDQLDVLRRDVVQSDHHFMTLPTSTPRPQLNMMTDLGFSRTVLSSSIISTLISQLMIKLDRVDTLIASNSSLISHWSQERASKFSAAKYCSVRRSISLKCVSLIDNGPSIRPLIERLISSPARTQIPNTPSTADQNAQMTFSSHSSDAKVPVECICGLSDTFIDCLFANGAQHFENLKIAAKAVLLFQCPRALSLELTRLIKNVVQRPLASIPTIQGFAANIIETSFVYPAVYLHCASILRQIILTSTHPCVIRLYSIISQELHQRLKRTENLKSHSLGHYWPQNLLFLIETNPTNACQYRRVNEDLQLLTGTRIHPDFYQTPSMASARTFAQESWFTVLAFQKWIRQAYYLGSKCSIEGEKEANNDIFAFLAWHAHPMSSQSRSRAYDGLVNLVPRVLDMFSSGGADIFEEVIIAPSVVHPFLIYTWDPAIHHGTYVIERVITYCLRNKTGITLCMILDYFEHLKATHGVLVHNSLFTLLEVIQVELKPHSTAMLNADVQARISSLLANI